MKKLRLVLAVTMLVGTTSVATAQDPQPQQQGQRPGGRGNMMAMMMQGITLSAEQQAKVDSLSAKFAGERQALMQDESLDQDAQRPQQN